MTRLMILMLASTSLAACTTTMDNDVTMGQEPRPEAPEVDTAIVDTDEVENSSGNNATTASLSDDPAGQPELGTYGFDQAGAQPSIAPGDDFYRYANGVWSDTTEIPADKSNYSMFGALDDLSKDRTKAIILEEANKPSSRIGAAYTAFMDEATIEAKGMAPIQPILAEIEAVDSWQDYARQVGRGDRLGFGGAPLLWYVGQDSGDSSRYILTLYQSGLGLPDRDYYLQDSERFTSVRSAYVDYLTDMLSFAGVANGRERAQAILDYETKLAEVHWDRNRRSDSEETYNPMSVAEMKALYPDWDWDTMYAQGDYDFSRLNVATPSAISEGLKIASNTDLRVLKDKMLVSAVSSFSSALPAAVNDRNFAFYSTTLSGVPEQEVRWKRGVDFVSGTVRDDVGKLYAEKHFPPEYKAEMMKLVDNVIDAMRERIVTADWMAEETKPEAMAKLAKFTTKIGYPDRWETYEGLVMRPDDLFGNVQRRREWSHQDSLAKLNEPLRRWEWGMAPMTVNAYANFGQMEIVFPASILQPPFFDPAADPAINYGGIGAVIGHEISHHFDDQGAKYDSDGNLKNWWTDEDYKRFEARGKALIDQYDAYEIFPGEYVDGTFTLGENIGDLAGLSIAYDAYKKSLGGKEAPIIDGTTGDQRFFLGWAQVWRRNYRDEELKRRLKTDSHSPSVQRVWVIRNIDAWYDAFDIGPDDAMYLAPEDRVTVW